MVRFDGTKRFRFTTNGACPWACPRGRADVYRSTIAHRWIDIAGVPNGEYRIQVFADPPISTGGRFLELNESNNKGWTTVRITGSSITILSRSGASIAR